jgi:hypothetical protein
MISGIKFSLCYFRPASALEPIFNSAINREIFAEDVTKILGNNPPDVVCAASRDAVFQGPIRMFQRDNEMRNIVLTDAQAKEQASRQFFNRLAGSARDQIVNGEAA